MTTRRSISSRKTCADRSYGARPLRRALQKYIEDPLSEALIQGRRRAAVLRVYLGDTGIYLSAGASDAPETPEAVPVGAGEGEAVAPEPVADSVLFLSAQPERAEWLRLYRR